MQIPCVQMQFVLFSCLLLRHCSKNCCYYRRHANLLFKNEQLRIKKKKKNLVRKLVLAGFRSLCEHRLSLYLLVKAAIQRNSRGTLQSFCACPCGLILQPSPWRKLPAGTCAHGKNTALNKGTFSNWRAIVSSFSSLPGWMWLSLWPRGSNCSWHQRNPMRGYWHSQN